MRSHAGAWERDGYLKLSVIIWILLLAVLAFPANAATTHCMQQEQVVFSCSLGKKTVSVCASNDLSVNKGYLQYRIGQINATPELILPAAIDARHTIKARTLMFSGGGGGYLRFINGSYHYIVYTAIGKGWGVKDGVAVEKDGRLIVNLSCQDIPSSILGPEFFSVAGLLEDEDEFLLP